jgi:hypothetical protein
MPHCLKSETAPNVGQFCRVTLATFMLRRGIQLEAKRRAENKCRVVATCVILQWKKHTQPSLPPPRPELLIGFADGGTKSAMRAKRCADTEHRKHPLLSHTWTMCQTTEGSELSSSAQFAGVVAGLKALFGGYIP